jgi:uroporphyrin-III C-methyltransferase
MTAQDPSFGTGIAGRIAAFLRVVFEPIPPESLHTLPTIRAEKHGHVSLVGAGPGSADLITMRGMERLRRADAVFYDRLADPALLGHARHGAVITYVGKTPGCRAMPQDRINALLVDAALRGLQVVRLKCGDPGIFARGAEEAAALDAAGIRWDIVPGVTAACAAGASARSFLTERSQTDRLILATGHLRANAREPDWSGSARAGTTLVCYMSVATVGRTEAGLLSVGWPSASTVEIVSRSQTACERVMCCRLDRLAATVADHGVASPAVLILRWPMPAAPRSIPLAEVAAAARELSGTWLTMR